MKTWSEFQFILCEVLVLFLKKEIGNLSIEDRYTKCIKNALSNHHSDFNFPEESSFKYERLQFTDLLRLLDKNLIYFQLGHIKNLQIRNLCHRLREVRNRHAHDGIEGISERDFLDDVSAAMRLLKELNASDEKTRPLKEYYETLVLKIAHGISNRHQNEKDNIDQQRGIPEQSAVWIEEEARRQNKLFGSEILDNVEVRSKIREELKELANAKNIQSFSVVWSIFLRLIRELNGFKTKIEEESSESPIDSNFGQWIYDDSINLNEIKAITKEKTFVGIDFGTSTTVVSYYSANDQESGAKVLEIDQPLRDGGEVTNYLIPTVLALKKNKGRQESRIIFGLDAYEVKPNLQEGRNVFSSFKMALGINLGPIYPRSSLAKGLLIHGSNQKIQISSAKDATREFFKLVIEQVKLALEREGISRELKVAITVPASFESNQRSDLVECLRSANIKDYCLIDEPNAAFLSFLHSVSRENENAGFLNDLEKKKNIIVYDIGAGTCDVSILQISAKDRNIKSKNLAISRFTDLGGDDFDRAIVRSVLIPQLIDQYLEDEEKIYFRDINERILPKLLPTAEKLKKLVIEWLILNKITTEEDLLESNDQVFTLQSISLKLPDLGPIVFKSPTLTVKRFFSAIKIFLGEYNYEKNRKNIFSPVQDVLDKSRLKTNEIDSVLFIGGSAKDPLIRNAVMKNLSPNVEAIVPKDLQTHVAKGAALHSLGKHGFKFDIIQPITAESILVLISDGEYIGEQIIIPSGTNVPSEEAFEHKLEIARNGQMKVGLPFCVGNQDKLLGIVWVESDDPNGFEKRDWIQITASLNRDKTLDVRVTINQKITNHSFENPMSNQTQTEIQKKMLIAKQEYNYALFKEPGKPPPERIILDLAKYAYDAEEWETAASNYELLERLGEKNDYANQISICCDRMGLKEKSEYWSEIAFDRKPTATRAYNIAYDKEDIEDKISWLDKSIRLDSKLPDPYYKKGQILEKENIAGAEECFQKAYSILKEKFLLKINLKERELLDLTELAERYGNTDLRDNVRQAYQRFKENKKVASFTQKDLASGKANFGKSDE